MLTRRPGKRFETHVAVHAIGDVDRGDGVARLLQPAQPVERGLADDAVDVEPRVALELGDRHLEQRREDAVHGPAVETQLVEPALQKEHVVAPHVRHAQVQQPVAGLVAGLHEFGPGVVLDDAVGKQQTLLLERPDGVLGVRPEEPVGALPAQEIPQGSQARLDVDHLLACIASANGTHPSRLSETSSAGSIGAGPSRR